ncbi:telomerase protein component 1 [Eurytemora carolleeae]|uniref:telomerase protein component 1 n=1 Tax=Eurytemora carolleeae TaxID=1294199 RepID=UPI000C755B21|nr:telomerase protein component 1 [Eurytemora carolleeae]|eukprot:XP_023330860.1 telomerase protein component 1-like [Eurytemora affinis]
MKSKLKNVTDFKLKIMKRSLDTAVNISARINVPPLQGRSLVLCSYGLDGLVKMGAGRGIGNTGATLRDTALLYSVMVSARAEESNLVLFSKSCVKVSLEKTDLLKNIELVSKLEEVQTLSNFNASLDPVKRILHEYIRDDIYVDNIILFHNNIQVQTHRKLKNYVYGYLKIKI